MVSLLALLFLLESSFHLGFYGESAFPIFCDFWCLLLYIELAGVILLFVVGSF